MKNLYCPNVLDASKNISCDPAHKNVLNTLPFKPFFYPQPNIFLSQQHLRKRKHRTLEI